MIMLFTRDASLSQCNQLRWTHVDTVRMRVHKTAEERTVTYCVSVQEFVLGADHAMTDSRANAIEEEQLNKSSCFYSVIDAWYVLIS